eukprot:TRINITY_DN14535_c0_g1_i8.p1 TRINITY_DN14535_c0_g1~~TRINITY_DN14535_c0_g1_i8.p1  ORF type:complete len:918 (+),score=241.05 TRINITY_DN14535_c0_g1_i8:264-3017(+)
MVTAVLIAALSSAAAVSPPKKIEVPRSKNEDAHEEGGTRGDDEKQEGKTEEERDEMEQEGEEEEREDKISAADKLTKEELLLTIETTDSEIAKLEARLAELKEEEEAEQANEDSARQYVIPDPTEYSVDFVDLRGQQIQTVYVQNQKTRVRAQRKVLLARFMPPDVLEKVTAGIPLYTCPQDLPSYHENIQTHKSMRLPLLEALLTRREAYRRKCNKLSRQWHIINAKYEHKQRSKNHPSASKNNRGGRSGGGGRSSLRSNSAISARSPRGDMARSDMELNQIIADLEEEERYRRRFEFNLAKIPDMVVDPKEREAQLFISKNALVEDPVYENRLFCLADMWKEEEKKLFFDKYMSYPKNFRKIAAALPYKTTQDCIRFYYRYKKELDLKTKLKKHQLKKRPGKKGSATVVERTPHKLEPPQILGKHERDDTNGDAESAPPPAKKSKLENWTDQDKSRFIRHIKAIGKDWKKLSRAMGSVFSATDVQYYYESCHESIETILVEQAQQKKEAEAKARAKKEARKQAQQAIQQQQQQQAAPPKPESDQEVKPAVVVKPEVNTETVSQPVQPPRSQAQPPADPRPESAVAKAEAPAAAPVIDVPMAPVGATPVGISQAEQLLPGIAAASAVPVKQEAILAEPSLYGQPAVPIQHDPHGYQSPSTMANSELQAASVPAVASVIAAVVASGTMPPAPDMAASKVAEIDSNTVAETTRELLLLAEVAQDAGAVAANNGVENSAAPKPVRKEEKQDVAQEEQVVAEEEQLVAGKEQLVAGKEQVVAGKEDVVGAAQAKETSTKVQVPAAADKEEPTQVPEWIEEVAVGEEQQAAEKAAIERKEPAARVVEEEASAAEVKVGEVEKVAEEEAAAARVVEEEAPAGEEVVPDGIVKIEKSDKAPGHKTTDSEVSVEAVSEGIADDL